MKIFKIYYLLIAVLIVSACTKENKFENDDNGITLEDAKSNQIITFKIGVRDIKLTEFKEDSWPFSGKIIQNNIEYDVYTEYPLKRSIYASIPKDQALEDNLETFGLEFNQLFSLNDLNSNLNKVIDEKQFRREFARIGEQNPLFTNFGYHQTYLIGKGERVKITNVENIIGHKNMIFVTGMFSGNLGFNIDITKGRFKVLIEN